MSFSLNKLKSFLPGKNSSMELNKRHSVNLEPEVGFQLTLEPYSSNNSASDHSNDRSNVPQLNVHLIAARHLPSLFGFKSVQGYLIKVKLFPGSKRYDSSIQTCSWPKFNETFKFPLGPEIKPSLKTYSKDKTSFENLPELCFSGHFVVFTVYVLLELPPGTFNRFKGTYRSLRDRGVLLLKNKTEQNKSKDDAKEKQNEPTHHLTISESKRNIGSVTCYLEPKLFKKSPRGNCFITEEIWSPIKDITATPLKSSNLSSSPKGQIEIILEVWDSTKEENIPSDDNEKSNATTTKRHWSLTDVKKKIKVGKSTKQPNDLCLKVTTSKMRCSIKVKDEFENAAGPIYIKTSVFEHNILSNYWRSESFLPSLSNRWDNEVSTIVIPLNDENNLNDISIRTTVATKNKVGKKLVLGTVLIGPQMSGVALEHWDAAISTRNEPIAMYHNFV